MVEPQRDDNPHIQNLLTWAEEKCQLGIGGVGLGIDRPFTPNPEIKAYSDEIRPIQKLLAALFPDGVPEVDPERIRKEYAKVFLILILTDNGCFITFFVCHDSLCDQYLPFGSLPPNFPQ